MIVGEQTTPAQPKRILIVDDEVSVRRLLARSLTRAEAGYEIIEAADGVEAQDILARRSVDVVISDLAMPRMCGLDLMQWAQSHHAGPTWIILTGQEVFEDAVRAVQLGAFDFVNKSSGMVEALLVTVRNACNQRQLAAERLSLQRQLAEQNIKLQEQVAHLRVQADTIEEDIRRAELIQRSLLPRCVPEMDGFALNGMYRPCQNIGGDLYGIVPIGKRHIGIYIADATGHGVAAAMLAVLFQQSLHPAETDHQPKDPRSIFVEANASLISECIAPAMFITATYALLDVVRNTLTVVSAGHPPLLLHRACGDVERISCAGPALGLFAGANFEMREITLNTGDRLLFYTDGLCGLSRRKGSLTTDDVTSILAQSGLSGQGLLQKLLDAGSACREGARQQDDIAMLLLANAAEESSLDNGTPLPVQVEQPVSVSVPAETLIGSTNGSTVISIRGEGAWTACRAFHDACMNELNVGRELIFDMSLCSHLDSTFLGTIQEIVSAAESRGRSVGLQGIQPDVRRLFEELGMDQVLLHICVEAHPLPDEMSPLNLSGPDEIADRWRIILAHEALASLSSRNRQEFVRLIECVRKELHQKEHEAAMAASTYE